jgi:hypothetical protein
MLMLSWSASPLERRLTSGADGAIDTLETNLGGRLRIPAYDPKSYGDVGLACRTRECIMQSLMII